MRVLLDESLPRRLRLELADHDVSTVPEVGWAGTKNGELLRLAEPAYDVFVTMDSSLPSQQNLTEFQLCVIILRAKSNDIADLMSLTQDLRAAIQDAKACEVVVLEA